MRVFCSTVYRSLAIERMFRDAGHIVVANVADSDLVVLGGGADVDPRAYGQAKHRLTNSSEHRDSIESAIVQRARSLNLPIVGICRGAQLLHVLNGGSLYQDVDNHRRNHPVTCVGVEEPEGFENPVVTSTHHQQMMIQDVAEVVADNPYELLVIANESTFRDHCTETGQTIVNTSEKHVDAEVILYPSKAMLCFQPHPEHSGGNASFTFELFRNCLKKSFGLAL